MVRSFHYLQLLSSATIAYAQASTYVALPSSAYDVTLTTKPTPGPDEIAVQEDNGDINLFPGANRRDAIKKARAGCGGKFDNDCYNAMAKAWGYGGDGDGGGISKRFGFLIGAAVVGGISILISGLYMYQNDEAFRVPKLEFDKITKGSAEATNVYVGGDATITVTASTVPTPTGNAAPAVTQAADSSVNIYIPDDLVDQAKKAAESIVCKRSIRIMRRVEIDDELRSCIERAAEDIAKNTDLGGWLSKFQGVHWEINVPNAPNEIPLPPGFDDIEQGLQDTVDLLSIFGPAAERIRDGIAHFSLLLSWAQLGAGVEISGKMNIPAEKMKQKSDDGDATCKNPSKDGAYFCNQECGGKNPQTPGRKPSSIKDPNAKLDDYSQIWSCKGVDDKDDKKGCDCIIPHPSEHHFYEGIGNAIAESQKILNGDKFDAKPTSSKVDVGAWCYKSDAKFKDKMKDHANWMFLEQKVLDANIQSFCNQDWDIADVAAVIGSLSGVLAGEKVRSKDYGNETDLNWVTISVTSNGKKENCVDRLMAISAGCDFDREPDVTKNKNQFNWKWGGESTDKDNATWIIQPRHPRVVSEERKSETSGFHIDTQTCEPLDKFSDKGNKGLNGAVMDDEALMTLQQCIAQLVIFDSPIDVSCGGLLTMGLHPKGGYKDIHNCANKTYECLSYYIDHSQAARGHHRPGFTNCYAELKF